MVESVETVAPRGGPLRALYAWIMKQASGRYAWWVLAAVSFAESSFFPLPPDVMLVPMMLADRKRAWWMATWCALWSVLGGLLGYAIGSLLYDSVGQWLISFYGMGDDMAAFRKLYGEYGAWVIVLKGFTPIPYKIVTIASGFAGYALLPFIVLSLITRWARFAIVAALLHRYGSHVSEFIEKKLEWVAVGVIVVVIGGFVLARYAF